MGLTAATLVVVAVLAVIALSRSTITFALPGGTGSITSTSGVLASVVDLSCLIVLVVLLVLVFRHRRRSGPFWASLLMPLLIATVATLLAVTAETPSF